jgi:cytochrome c peroxidase
MTAPYGHSGVFPTLQGIVEHHLSPEKSIAAFSPAGLNPAINATYWRMNTMKALGALSWARTMKQTTLFDQTLSAEQVSNLVEFLRALTDPCVKDAECLKPWLADS